MSTIKYKTFKHEDLGKKETVEATQRYLFTWED